MTGHCAGGASSNASPGAVPSTVNVVAPVPGLPAASVARTVTVWAPSASDAAVNGEMQVARGPPSTWHWIDVAPPVTVNDTLGVRSLVGDATAATVTTGGTVSTVNVVASVPGLPAASVARTVTV
ncbi:MAG TPA: hypothetical protein VLM79_22025 [Kofleriaceae bacterium]|nr:hypothetical protein [Kofleriaceae bacterium]